MSTATATLTTLNDLVNTEVISRLVQAAAQEAAFLPALCYQEDVTLKGSLTANFAVEDALTAAAVNENADVTPSAFSTSQGGAITASEVAIGVSLSKKSRKTSGLITIDRVVAACARALADKIQNDGCATFSSFTTTVGTTTVNLQLSDLDEALYELKTAKAPTGNDSVGGLPPALTQVQSVLHTRQAGDMRIALRAAGANFVGTDQLGIFLEGGRRPVGLMGEYMGVTFWESTKPPTANGGADRNGAMFVPAALGYVFAGPPEMETENDASARSLEVIMTALYAFGVIRVAFGVGIVTDA